MPPIPSPPNASPLEWLASRQQADGGETRIAISARAALCFLGMGYDHKTPNVHRETVARALRWLSASGSGPTAESGAWRVMALAEAYAMTADKDLRIPAVEAVTDLIGRRSGAGWPGPAVPASIDARSTVVGIMALKSARAAGAGPAEVGPALQAARAWVTEVAWTRHAKPFPATWPIDGSRGDAPGADPEFLAMAVFLGLRAGTEVTDELAARVAGAPPPADPFRHYLRCLGLFQVGGAAWKAMADQGSAAGLTAAAASGAVGRMTFAALEHGVHVRFQAVHKAPVVTPVAPPGEVRAPQGF